jgi:hypothetical protein
MAIFEKGNNVRVARDWKMLYQVIDNRKSLDIFQQEKKSDLRKENSFSMPFILCVTFCRCWYHRTSFIRAVDCKRYCICHWLLYYLFSFKKNSLKLNLQILLKGFFSLFLFHLFSPDCKPLLYFINNERHHFSLFTTQY